MVLNFTLRNHTLCGLWWPAFCLSSSVCETHLFTWRLSHSSLQVYLSLSIALQLDNCISLTINKVEHWSLSQRPYSIHLRVPPKSSTLVPLAGLDIGISAAKQTYSPGWQVLSPPDHTPPRQRGPFGTSLLGLRLGGNTSFFSKGKRMKVEIYSTPQFLPKKWCHTVPQHISSYILMMDKESVNYSFLSIIWRKLVWFLALKHVSIFF